ncbi:hypothetical protein [Marinivivus vitaminiproducens]|uniref:hypothetical protein n=1 Tax=Marinivivus vitaminiproducens TaxID=3035935 RepID=UPI002799689C|nr:hypothetical protein P4R82_24695 [Geminicoccaceae bacterium SCSIO 64248]
MPIALTFAQRFRALEESIVKPDPLRRAIHYSDERAIERGLYAWEIEQQLDLAKNEDWDRYLSVREALYDAAADAAAEGMRLYPDPHAPERASLVSRDDPAIRAAPEST